MHVVMHAFIFISFPVKAGELICKSIDIGKIASLRLPQTAD